MLTKREAAISWSFVLGVTVIQAIGAAWVFRPHDGWLAFLQRYLGNPPGTALAWSLSLAVVVAYVSYSSSRSAVIRRYAFNPAAWGPVAGLRLIAIPMAFVTGFFEEAFFRKYLMDLAQDQGIALWLQVLGSAVIFGATHAIWAVFGGKFRAALFVMLATMALGAALALVYLAGARSIGPCVAAHVAINLLLEPWLIITSATRSWGRPAATGGSA